MWQFLIRSRTLGILAPVVLLSAAGILSLYSSGGTAGRVPIFSRQLVWFAVGAVLMLLLSRVDYRTLSEFWAFIYIPLLLSLVVLLVFGERIANMRGWYRIGPISVQPSEFMKIGVLIAVARLFSHYSRPHITLDRFLLAGAVVGAPMAMILLQPDMGTAIVFVAIFGTAIYMAGLKRYVVTILLILAIAVGVFSWFYVLKDYQKNRITTFFRPEVDSQKTGYHIIQSRIAIGNGGFFGKGLGAGTQSKLGFVPEMHTDFIFPVFAEEFGFLGASIVLALYFYLIFQCLRIAESAPDKLGAFIVIGFVGFFGFHVLINLGTVMGLLPTIGIPLPLMSYGGSAMVTTLAGFGLVMSVASRKFGT
jgi:rod shape determining protein RodA